MTNTLNTLSKVATQQRPRTHTSLLDLIKAINQVTDSDMLVVATARHLVNFNDTRLTGSFRNKRMVIG